MASTRARLARTSPLQTNKLAMVDERGHEAIVLAESGLGLVMIE